MQLKHYVFNKNSNVCFIVSVTFNFVFFFRRRWKTNVPLQRQNRNYQRTRLTTHKSHRQTWISHMGFRGYSLRARQNFCVQYFWVALYRDYAAPFSSWVKKRWGKISIACGRPAHSTRNPSLPSVLYETHVFHQCRSMFAEQFTR